MDRNSPNSILPERSSSTESMRALISSLVSKSPTENSNSSSSSMPMEPVCFSSRELKYCFISLRSSLSKSMRYFLPLRMSQRRCSYCLRQCSWSRTSHRPRPPPESSPVRSLCERISSRMRECWMSAVRSPRRVCLLIEGKCFDYSARSGGCVYNLMKGMREDCVYRLKVLVLGDKGVGKTSLILSFLHGAPPEPALLPPAEDLYFFTKRQDYPLQRPSERDLFEPATRYECRFHIWDLGAACYSRDALSNFREQKFYENTVALIYVFRDEASLEFLRRTVFAGLPRLEISSKQSQFLVYNPFREPVRALEEQARAVAPKEYIYVRLQPSDVSGVRKLFETILEQTMFKIKDGILTNALMRDRDNNVLLRDRRNSDQQHQRKYNRCC